MEVIPISDLPKHKAIAALKSFRKQYFKEELSPEILESVYQKVGGRLSYLNRIAKAENMMELCDALCQREKIWFLNKCWILGPGMDDDVMDEQKYSVSIQISLARHQLTCGAVHSNGSGQGISR